MNRHKFVHIGSPYERCSRSNLFRRGILETPDLSIFEAILKPTEVVHLRQILARYETIFELDKNTDIINKYESP